MRTLLAVLLALLFSGCGEGTAQLDQGEGSSSTRGGALAVARLRVMAGNLTSGTRQSYDPGEGARIFRAAAPDVALLQEFNVGDNSTAALRGFVDAAFGPEFQYVRGAPAQIPNGIVSRYPIVASGDWADPFVSNRHFTWARLDVPGPTDAWVVSLHLLTASASVRLSEAQALVATLQASVPPGDFLIVGGDLNTAHRFEPALRELGTLVVTNGPWPVDAQGDGDTNAGRSRPYDWVTVSPNLAVHATATTLGGLEFPMGAVVDTRVFSPIEALAPALATDSAAAQMQHMGVVRDFLLPDARPPRTALRLESPNGGEQLVAGTDLEVRWSAEGLETVDVSFSLDGATFAPVATGVDAALGAISWTLPAALSTRSAVLRVSAGGLADDSDERFSVRRPALVRLDELLANEPGSATAAEFIELLNEGESPADLSGWTLSDAAAVRHRFPVGTTLAPGARLVVYGGPSGVPSGALDARAASTGTLSLNNASDTVTLADASGAPRDLVAYGWALAAIDGVSMTRTAQGFALHASVSPLTSSPGAAP